MNLIKMRLDTHLPTYHLSDETMNDTLKTLPSVNAIVSICNWAERLGECLEHLRSQKYDGVFTITVVDCGSHDNTTDIAKEYGCEILTRRGAPVEGLIGLTNYGIKNSKAELIWKVDADNLMVDSMVLRKLIQPFLDDPEVNLSVPRPITNENYNSFTNYLTLREQVIHDEMILDGTMKPCWILLEDMWYGICNSTLMKRSSIDKVGGWDRDIRVLGRMRNMGLARGAMVKDACFYHDQRVNLIPYLKKISKRIQYFGSMDDDTAAKYFVRSIQSAVTSQSTIQSLRRESSRFLKTMGQKPLSNALNEFLYQASILLSLAYSPLDTFRLIKRGFYL